MKVRAPLPPRQLRRLSRLLAMLTHHLAVPSVDEVGEGQQATPHFDSDERCNSDRAAKEGKQVTATLPPRCLPGNRAVGCL